MDVYFVRHGETLLNKKNIHQSPSTPLSSKGYEQSQTVAELLRPVSADILITSEYVRAKETARIIGTALGLTPQVNDLFFEIERPSSLYGRSHFCVETFWYVILSVVHKNDSTWKYTDAENFTDISIRAKRALAYLEKLANTHASVVVVSHNIFINIMVAYLCSDRMIAVRDLIGTFLHVKRMKNAGVVHLAYDAHAGDGTCAWQLVNTL